MPPVIHHSLCALAGVQVKGMNGEQAATRLRGPAGSQVLLTVRHGPEVGIPPLILLGCAVVRS